MCIRDSLHGLTRTLIQNMVVGVSQGYEKVLEVNGVGYRAQKSGKMCIRDRAWETDYTHKSVTSNNRNERREL